MHRASYEKDKNSTIRYTQQKWHPAEKAPLKCHLKIMAPYKKWHMTNTPPKTDKYDTSKKWCLTKMAHLAKKCPNVICQGLS